MRLISEMLPPFAKYRVANGTSSSAHLRGNLALRHTCRIELSHLDNVIYSKRVLEAMLTQGILNVGVLGALEKMSRVNARRVIASMANLVLWPKDAAVKYKRKAVAIDLFATWRKVTIATLGTTSRPYPAVAGFVNVRPKTIQGICPAVAGVMAFGKTTPSFRWLTTTTKACAHLFTSYLLPSIPQEDTPCA